MLFAKYIKEKLGAQCLKLSDYVALISLIISAITLIYTWRSNTKRYELKDQYRLNLLDWYKETIRIIMELRDTNNSINATDCSMLLAKLSAQIEIGRFFLPNNIGSNGKEKSLAYQGNRHLALDSLVSIYTAVKSNSKSNNISNEMLINHIDNMERRFTSIIFKIIVVRAWNKERARNLDLMAPEDIPRDELRKTYGK